MRAQVLLDNGGVKRNGRDFEVLVLSNFARDRVDLSKHKSNAQYFSHISVQLSPCALIICSRYCGIRMRVQAAQQYVNVQIQSGYISLYYYFKTINMHSLKLHTPLLV